MFVSVVLFTEATTPIFHQPAGLLGGEAKLKPFDSICYIDFFM
jgi:hypothetical protein